MSNTETLSPKAASLTIYRDDLLQSTFNSLVGQVLEMDGVSLTQAFGAKETAQLPKGVALPRYMNHKDYGSCVEISGTPEALAMVRQKYSCIAEIEETHAQKPEPEV